MMIITRKSVTSEPEKLEKGQKRYRVEANLRLYAVIEFEFVPKNETDADRGAAKLLDQCEPMISVAIPESDFVEVSLHHENVEPELLDVWEIRRRSCPSAFLT